MVDKLEPHFPASGSFRRQVAAALHKLGKIDFWLQFVLTIISVIILLFAVADPNLNLNLKSGLSLFSAIGGIAALGYSKQRRGSQFQLLDRLHRKGACGKELHDGSNDSYLLARQHS